MKTTRLIACDTLGDHPPDQVRFYAHCREQHSAPLHTDNYPPAKKLNAIRARLLCFKCGSRSVKLLTVGAGGTVGRVMGYAKALPERWAQRDHAEQPAEVGFPV